MLEDELAPYGFSTINAEGKESAGPYLHKGRTKKIKDESKRGGRGTMPTLGNPYTTTTEHCRVIPTKTVSQKINKQIS